MEYGVEETKAEGGVQKRKKRVSKDMTPDEKRSVYLDRNKAAALKCRQRKKRWLEDTQYKADTLQKLTNELKVQLSRLKEEQRNLVNYLTLHRNCGSEKIGQVLDGMVQWERELLTLQGPEPPQFPMHLEGEFDSAESGGESGEE